MSELERLREIVARLRAPDGCPWDREQTHSSLCAHLVEEAYEVAEAIDRNDDPHLREELGDLLLQVVMHAQIAAETGRFDLEQIAGGIADKLVRRHPHVFGENKLPDSDAVLKQWDEIKRGEKGDRPESILDGVSMGLPALMRATKVQQRAARVGFDWAELHSVVEKIREEVLEVEAEIRSGARERLEEEIGDLLFTVVNLTRKAKFEAELLLNNATGKFISRFQKLEAELKRSDQKFEQLTLEDLDEIWNGIKADKSR
ncbi:MAG: nucleoside triphosphate diphosphatase [Chthoniobacter sp.]|nr:nucleoside triphosphate diphosphatase [Chthoniobacter sp.]